jgi:hypothetical protein
MINVGEGESGKAGLKVAADWLLLREMESRRLGKEVKTETK